MTARWIWIVLASFLTTGCGEVTVRPFVEASDAGVVDDGDAGDDDGDDGDEDGGEDDAGVDDDDDAGSP